MFAPCRHSIRGRNTEISPRKVFHGHSVAPAIYPGWASPDWAKRLLAANWYRLFEFFRTISTWKTRQKISANKQLAKVALWPSRNTFAKRMSTSWLSAVARHVLGRKIRYLIAWQGRFWHSFSHIDYLTAGHSPGASAVKKSRQTSNFKRCETKCNVETM